MHKSVRARITSSAPAVRILESLVLFLGAGLMEIDGGYLVWLWLRNDRSVWLGALGGLLLVLYGVLPTMQPAGFDFGRVYAAYGDVFVCSRCCGRIDGIKPDVATVVGAVICLIGVGVADHAMPASGTFSRRNIARASSAAPTATALQLT